MCGYRKESRRIRYTDGMTIWNGSSDVNFNPLNVYRGPIPTLVAHGTDVVDKINGTRDYGHGLDETR